MTQEPPVAQFIRNHFSRDGLEIDGVGEDSVRVRMPPNFTNLTDFCARLQEEHGAFVDYCVEENTSVTSVILEVYTTDITVSRNEVGIEAEAPALEGGAASCVYTMAMSIACSAVAAGAAYALRFAHIKLV